MFFKLDSCALLLIKDNNTACFLFFLLVSGHNDLTVSKRAQTPNNRVNFMKIEWKRRDEFFQTSTRGSLLLWNTFHIVSISVFMSDCSSAADCVITPLPHSPIPPSDTEDTKLRHFTDSHNVLWLITEWCHLLSELRVRSAAATRPGNVLYSNNSIVDRKLTCVWYRSYEVTGAPNDDSFHIWKETIPKPSQLLLHAKGDMLSRVNQSFAASKRRRLFGVHFPSSHTP